jgi:hypothetical protein
MFCSTARKFSGTFFLGLEVFLGELIHLHEFNLIGVSEGRVNTAAVDEFAGLGLNLMLSSSRKKSMNAWRRWAAALSLRY